MDDTNIRRPLAVLLPELIAVAEEILAQIPTLGELSYSPDAGRVGVSLSSILGGALSGSTFSGVGVDGTAIDPDTGAMEGVPTQEGAFDLVVTETNARAKNSPRSSTIRFNVLPAIIAPRHWTADTTAIRADGTGWTADGTIKGGTTPPIGRAFFSNPFFADPFFRNAGTTPRLFFSSPFFSDPFFRTGA